MRPSSTKLIKAITLFSFLALIPALVKGQKATFKFSYEVHAKDLPKDGESFSIVIPIPESDRHQTIQGLSIESNVDYKVKSGSKFSNRYLVAGKAKGEIPRNFDLSMNFKVKREAIESEKKYQKGSENLQRFKKPDRLIPINSQIRKEASKALDGEESTMQKAKAFYDYLVNSMTYDKSGEGWGRGDAVYACNAKKGNCTDFHSLFIGMSRSVDIPARFHVGFPIPQGKKSGKVKGYHCWAEFFHGEKGWVPVDISEAWKNKEKSEYYFGALDPFRVRFTSGRDVPVKIHNGVTKKLNYFVYPKFYKEGVPYKDFNTQFSFKQVPD